MSASNSSGERIAAENELLAQLGLPPSATPEDVDQLHLAVSQFLAAAPSSLKGWAHAQAAALDEAYLTLTDPVGLEGSALRSPMRPPTVVPGGPATPPARRGPAPADTMPADVSAGDEIADAAVAEPEPIADAETASMGSADDTDTEDMDALYASVTPGAHRDMVSGGKEPRPPKPQAPAASRTVHLEPRRNKARVRSAVVATPVPPTASAGPWKLVAVLVSAVLALVVAFGFVIPFVFNLGAGAATTANTTPAPSASGPTVDMAQVTSLMTQLQSKPNDIDTLQALGNVYFAGADYLDALSFYNKVIAVDPKNFKALLAAGAAAYNQQDTATAERLWKQVVALNPTDKTIAQEVHYDLGVLYMHATSPDWSAVMAEWKQVLEIDSTTDYAQQVQQYAAAIGSSSMVPASLAPGFTGLSSFKPSGSTATGSAAPSGSPSASGSAASASPAASGSAVASPVSTIVTEGAVNLAFTANSLSAPANTPFTLHFDNKDNGLPHDILIKDTSGTTVFHGDMVTGPTAVDYQVPALAAGTYTFTCTIHPTTMNGTLKVGS